MEPSERELLLQQLELSRDRVRQTARGLTPEQLVFRPSPEQWSISDCVEHISLVEERILAGVRKALSGPADPDKQAIVAMKSDTLVRAVPNRKHKVVGPPAVMPRREWSHFPELLDRFESTRDQTIRFAADCGPEVHDHFFAHAVFEELSCYQWLMMVGLHSERHVRQMEEVKGDLAFPMA